jgi:hypothetical protein
MTRFILALIRLMALALSFMLSTLTAAVFLTFVLFLGAEVQWLNDDPTVAVGSVAFALAAWLEISRVLFVPFLLVVGVAEFARLSSLLFNTLAGGGLAYVYMSLASNTFDLPYGQQEIWAAAWAAGFVGGLAYWMLAGYRAGRWLGPERTETRSDQD